MKHFLITLTVLISFLSTTQAQINIPDNVARYYLEQSERAKILTEQVVIKDKQISNLEKIVVLKDNFIETYKRDSVSFTKIIQLKDEQLELNKQQALLAKKEIRKQKIQKKLIGIGAIVVVVLAVL